MELTNENYLIAWSSPDEKGVFGMLVAPMHPTHDVADDGPLYRLTGNGSFEPAGRGYLSSTEGCCWAGWPPEDITPADHQRALMVLAISVMLDGVPPRVVWDEFMKIPVMRDGPGVSSPGAMFKAMLRG